MTSYLANLSDKRNIAEEIRKLASSLSWRDKFSIGGAPFTEEIYRSLLNYDSFLQTGLPNRQRVLLGRFVQMPSGAIAGYRATTILRNANPTDYERKHVHLTGPLTYAQSKTVFVHPAHRKEGYGSMLLQQSLEFAKYCNGVWVADVREDNVVNDSFLTHHGAVVERRWNTVHSTPMRRYIIKTNIG